MDTGRNNIPTNGRSGRNNWRRKMEEKGHSNHKLGNNQRFAHRPSNGNVIRNKSADEYNAFGFKRLTEFLVQTNDEVIMTLDKSINNFRQNLRQECNNDVMVLLIQIVGEKICGETSLQEIQNKLVTLSTESLFLDKILKFTSQIPSLKIVDNDNVDRCPARILNALSAFYGRLCARMAAFAADKLLPYIQGALNISELLCLKGTLMNDKTSEIESRFQNLIDEINLAKEAAQRNSTEEFRKKIRRRHEISMEDREKMYQMTPVDDFRQMKIIPSKEEILSDEEPFLRPNLTIGKYPSALTYLDVQFRLLREDFLAPLRESVKKYFLMNANGYDSKEKRPEPGTIRIYRDVKLHKVNCSIDTTLFTMKFSTINLKRVKWENSKRFLTGSLLLLTPDRFKNIYFATVGRRDDKMLPQGLIDIKWEGDRPDTYNNVKFLMIECEVYFESYRHTLRALQVMAEPCPPQYDRLRLETYKMTKYIVDVVENAIPPPEYLRTTKRINFGMVLRCNQEIIKSYKERLEQTKEDEQKPDRPELAMCKIDPLEMTNWPTATDLGMDEPQYTAFQSAITQELAIIQGPPGTGKTYIGLQIMKLLLDNSLGTADGPILVVCYTNHALDQFLEGIISIMDSLNIDPYGKLVRVGGQSKVEDVQQYNIRNIRGEYLKRKQFDENYASLRHRSRRELMLLADYRSDLKSLFGDLCYPNGVINFCKLNQQLRNESMSNDQFSIRSIFPGELGSIFLQQNGSTVLDFLGLNLAYFNSDKFSPETRVRNVFRLNPIVATIVKEAEGNKEAETSFEQELEDEELRGMLVAHRLEEEILEEGRKYNAERLQYHLYHKHDKKFKEKEDELYAELVNAERCRSYQDVRRFQGALYELGLQRNKFMNQCNFIKELLRHYLDGRIDLPKVTPELLAKTNEKGSLWQLTISEKWALYFHCIDGTKNYLLGEIIKMETKIIDAQNVMEEVKNQGDGFILKRAQVVGMTTTGAAKFNSVLRMIRSKIVIVEEAAEVLESHIITSLTEHCEHLILIGDHQQLRPPTTVYKLAKDYQLDVSLFERLIKNNISWQYLRAQHRMRPEICKLLVPTIYRDLENHPSVYHYPPVRGFLKNIFFVTHSNPEKSDNDSMTKSNDYEARYITQLCRYLMLQGYNTSQITILTTYIGQMFLIKKLMMQEGDTCKGVRVTVVDNFQGEENDIILLSLVRSNDENKIGFLRTDNRICVALSRAKQGFYIVGNRDCLVNSPSNTWQKISEELQEQESIGPGIKIRCQNHGFIMEVSSPEEFRQKSPEGGCTEMCPGILPRCDHACRKICHIVDSSHQRYQCKEECQRHCPDPERHKCQSVCYHYPCPPCKVQMDRTLLCGHVTKLPCFVDIVKYLCRVLVNKQLKCEHMVRLPCSEPTETYLCTLKVAKVLECGHTKLLPCYVPVTNYECIETVTKDLDCGHTGVMKCIDDPSKYICQRLTSRELPCGHQQMEPCKDDVRSIKCVTMFEEVNPNCKHKVQVPCHQLLNTAEWKCVEACDTRLNCGHQCVRMCHLLDDPHHLNYSCDKNCARSCINNHKCRRNHKCFEKCDPCKISTDKVLKCGHKINVSCSTNEETLKCEQQCQRETMPCGHECSKKCFMACDPCSKLTKKKSIDCPHTIEVPCNQPADRSKCNELVVSVKMSLCGHVVKVPCKIANTCSPEDCLQYCRQPCGYKFDYDGGCGHICQGDCGSCYQGRIHVKCSSKCERVLACGHMCKFSCSAFCPPCSDLCLLQCKHSKCKKKCGEPCIDCKERCKWSCEHSTCLKRCSEMCNRKPCNEPCKKKMKCGHDCIGCCGEPCPPYCRSCDKEKVEEILFGDEDNENARFVYLESCGHIIHRESMDEWMSQKTEKSGSTQINVKRCPKCSKVITVCTRYGNMIKKQFTAVLRIRKKIYGNSRAQEEQQLGIAQKIQRKSSDECQFIDVREFLEKNLFQMKQKNGKHGRQMVLDLINVDQFTFESLHNIELWWDEAERIWKESPQTRHQDQKVVAVLRPDDRKALLKMYNDLFGILLARKLPLSHHEIEDFDQEFAKLNDLYNLGLRRGIHSFDSFTGSLDMYNLTLQHIMQKNKPYDQERQKISQTYFTKLEEIIKTGWEAVKQKRVSDMRANRQSIFKAMGFAGNHWYTCRNGHLYVVGDCGAFNQSGNCPECQSGIGTGSARVAIRDEAAIQQQINSVVDIFPDIWIPPVVNDRSRNVHRNRNPSYNRRGRNRRGRRY